MVLCLVSMMAQGASVTPSQAVVPATGAQELVVEVSRFGRFAVRARSPQGTSVQLVDRMVGAGRVSGAPGREDGRIDAFLEEGQTKVVLRSDDAGTGEVAVEILPFDEVAAPVQPAPDRLYTSSLADLQQRSYWIEVGADPLVFEAVGRHVADLRLWRDGGWLEDQQPRCDAVEPVVGQPQGRCRLAASVPAGWYLATVYGGPSRPWTEADDAAPLSVRLGVPDLPKEGRRSGTIGPMGYDRYEVPAGPETFHIALPDTTGTQPTVQLDVQGTTAEIGETSRVPSAVLTRSGSATRSLTVTGPVGQPYTLTWFTSAPRGRRVYGTGSETFLATVHAGDPADSIHPTAVLLRRTRDGASIQSRVQGIPLGRQARYVKRFNLARETEVFLEVTEAGPYVVQLDDVDAKIAVDPMLDRPPPNFRPMKPRAQRIEVDLDAGLHVLKILPGSTGIATLKIAHNGWSSWLGEKLGTNSTDVALLRPAVQMTDLELDSGAEWQLVVRGQPDVPTGVVVRTLPIAARDGLPLTLMPGETVTVPVRVPDPGHLVAVMVDGSTLPLSVDGVPTSATTVVDPGAVTVKVGNAGAEPVVATLQFSDVDSRRPLPPMSPDGLPTFARLAAAQPAFLDLDRNDEATLEVKVTEDGMYRVQTTGLLKTRGAMRTRVRTGFAMGSANGIGRNFRMESFLRSGTYQVTVETLDATRGPLGLELARTPIVDGGMLGLGVPARVSLAPGSAVSYGLTLDAPTRVRILSEGLGGTYDCRVEDDDGWPMGTPQGSCDRDLSLPAGTYRILGAPRAVDNRRITTVSVLDDAWVQREGHGPHDLTVGQPLTHVWQEPAAGEDRLPDVWHLDVPAPISATIALSDEMVGVLVREGEPEVRLVPGTPWTGTLTPGRVTLQIRGARQGTGVPYRLGVTAEELVTGTERRLAVPTRVPVSVGADSVIRLASRGQTDVRARLLDLEGRLIATNDDRPDDWNFQLTTHVPEGRYTLVVDPVGSRSGSTVVGMWAPSVQEGPPLSRSTPITVRPGPDGALRLPVILSKGRDVVVVEAQSDENVGIALELATGSGSLTLGTATGRPAVLVARSPADGGEAHVRVWSEDGGDADVRIVAHVLNAQRAGERALAGGTSVGSAGSWGAVRSPPGLYALDASARDGLYVCAQQGCSDTPGPVVGGGAEGLILVRRGGRVTADRVQLSGSEEHVVRLGTEPMEVDLEPGRGPTVIRVRTSAGQPGVTFAREVSPSAMAVSRNAAVAVSLEGRSRARVWDAADHPVPLDARLSTARLSEPVSARAQVGRQPVTVPPMGAVVVDLPGGRHDVGLNLEAGLIAVTWEGTAVWADPDPTSAWIPQTTRRVWLLNPEPAAALATVDVVDSGEIFSEIAVDQPLERIAADLGTDVIRVAEGPGRLYTAGTARATYLRSDGVVVAGDGLEVGPGGILHLAHQPGPALAWIEESEPGPARRLRGVDRVVVSSGARIDLSGTAQRFEIRHQTPAVVQIQVPCPLVASIEVDGGSPPRVEVVSPGTSLDVWLPDGQGEIVLRSLQGAALFGPALVTVQPPVDIGEGLGPEVLLPPGGSHWFRFAVTRPGPIGIGVRSRADRVEATLVDATGVVRGSGVVRQVDLAPGTYFLRLTQPADRPPIRARPALAGIDAPSQGPPLDVVEGYRDLAARD